MDRKTRDTQSFNESTKTKVEREKLNKFKVAFEKVQKDKSNVPNMPDRYLSESSEEGLITHINVVKFKEHWASTLENTRRVTQSRESGVKYDRKELLRRRLMNYAVDNGIAVTFAK